MKFKGSWFLIGAWVSGYFVGSYGFAASATIIIAFLVAIGKVEFF